MRCARPMSAMVPAELRIIGESNAGGPFAGTVGAGEAARIFTGASVPTGADAVVIQEHTERSGDRADRARGGFARRQHPPGRRRLPSGRRAAARRTAARCLGDHARGRRRACANSRCAALPASPSWRPAMSWSSPARKPGAGQIVSSNPYGLAALIKRFGGEPQLLGIAGDTLEALEAKLATARGCRRAGHHRRRLGRRPRPRQAGAGGARHDARLLEGRRAPRQADAVRAPRTPSACSASPAIPSPA